MVGLRPDISVLIPAYEMGDVGPSMLARNLGSIVAQDILGKANLEVVVSDHSKGNEIFDVAYSFPHQDAFSLNYVRNSRRRGSSSANLNSAFEASRGQIIKILFQDDYLFGSDSLSKMLIAFEDHAISWAACGTTVTTDGVNFGPEIIPKFHDQIHLGENTISSPSVIAMRREAWKDFDKNLLWLMDVDLYKRLYFDNGPPFIIADILVVNGLGPHQVTNTRVSDRRKRLELGYVRLKHLALKVGHNEAK